MLQWYFADQWNERLDQVWVGQSKDGFVEEVDIQTRFERRNLVERFSGIEGCEERERVQQSRSGSADFAVKPHAHSRIRVAAPRPCRGDARAAIV